MIGSALALVLMALGSGGALASDATAAGEAAAGEAGFERNYVVGFKISELTSLGHEETTHLAGGGAFFEIPILHHALEIEGAARVLGGGHGPVLPLDVLIKKPFHVSDSLIPFIGVGPTAVVVFHGGTTAHFGGAASLGTSYWFTPQAGLVVEANYNAISEGGLVHEIGGNVGMAYGF